MVVNRISTQLLRIAPEDLEQLRRALERLESQGRPVINGLASLEIGLSKMKQTALFQACQVATPETALAIAGGRALPGREVLLKPPRGGFGKGIQSLSREETAPPDLDSSLEWIEQEFLMPVDGLVHRIELLGDRILYDAATPFQPGEFDYCLAKAGHESRLTSSEAIDAEVQDQALQIARKAGMELGALEYFLLADGRPCFFDFNPVSSLHPKAAELLGQDPIQMTADYILRSAVSSK